MADSLVLTGERQCLSRVPEPRQVPCRARPLCRSGASLRPGVVRPVGAARGIRPARELARRHHGRDGQWAEARHRGNGCADRARGRGSSLTTVVTMAPATSHWWCHFRVNQGTGAEPDRGPRRAELSFKRIRKCRPVAATTVTDQGATVPIANRSDHSPSGAAAPPVVVRVSPAS